MTGEPACHLGCANVPGDVAQPILRREAEVAEASWNMGAGVVAKNHGPARAARIFDGERGRLVRCDPRLCGCSLALHASRPPESGLRPAAGRGHGTRRKSFEPNAKE